MSPRDNLFSEEPQEAPEVAGTPASVEDSPADVSEPTQEVTVSLKSDAKGADGEPLVAIVVGGTELTPGGSVKLPRGVANDIAEGDDRIEVS